MTMSMIPRIRKQLWTAPALCLLPCVLMATAATAQEGRYDLAQRLRDLEEAWDQTEDASARARAVPLLDRAVRAFFALDVAQVAEYLDRARHALRGSEPPAASVRWSDSLAFRLRCRFVEVGAQQLDIQVQPLYQTDSERPQQASVRITLGGRTYAEMPLGDPPLSLALPLDGLAEGDHPLTMHVLVAGQAVTTRRTRLSLANELEARLGRLRDSLPQGGGATTIEQATFAHLLSLLSDLAGGRTMETDIPAARLLAEAEQLAQTIASGGRYYQHPRAGEFWLRVPVGTSWEVVRIFIPDGLSAEERVPVVFALHGAGGSENMFFDAYGAGITVKLCRDRGWVLVATRAAGLLGFGAAPRVVELLDALAERYPLDVERVYLIGHSMGAGHALAIAQRTPERFAGIALLGGGGSLRRPESVQALPMFVGVGQEDFAVRPARALYRELARAKAARVEFKEYENVEHLLIVREAAADVFRFWEGGAR